MTRDIAHKFKIDNAQAEQVKLMSQHSLAEDACNPSADAVRDQITKVVVAHYTQIFKLIDRHLTKAGLRSDMSRGYVLCGMGSKVDGLDQLLESVLLRPARLGALTQDHMPQLTQGWLGAAGLVHFIQKCHDKNSVLSRISPCRGVYKMLQRWVETYF